MSISTLRIATRQSPLAMWQAEYVQSRLQQLHPEGIRGIFAPSEIDEILQLTQKVAG